MTQDNNRPESKTKKTLKFILFILVCSASIAIISLLLVKGIEEANTVIERNEREKVDFEGRFVTFQKGKNESLNIILDVENGCLYIESEGVIGSPLIKDKQFDCSEDYIKTYNEKQGR